MRLRLVIQADFRLNDQSLTEGTLKKESIEMSPNDVITFVSGRGNQILFVWRPHEFDVTGYGARKGKAIVYRSQRLRLSTSTWSPDMLANYAAAVGITLDGIRKFEDIHKLEITKEEAPKKRAPKSGKERHLKAV